MAELRMVQLVNPVLPLPLALVKGSVLTNSVATYYSVPTNAERMRAIRLTSIRVVNTDTVARTFTLYIVPSGSSAGVANTRFKTISIAAAGSPDSSQYYVMNDVITQGDTIQALADAGSVVALSVYGEQF